MLITVDLVELSKMVDNAVRVGLAHAAEHGMPRFERVDVEVAAPSRGNGVSLQQAVGGSAPAPFPGLRNLFFEHRDLADSRYQTVQDELSKLHYRIQELEAFAFGAVNPGR